MDNASMLTWIELSRSALDHNITSLARLAGGVDMAVCVKANAYGHGLAETIDVIRDRDDCAYVTVHSLAEASACRDAGWRRRILLVGPFPLKRANDLVELDIEPLISDKSALRAVGKAAAKRKIRLRTHLKLETGTGRQGITEDEFDSFAKVYRQYDSLVRPYAAATHFANIEDTTNHEYAEYQLDRFDRMLRKLASLKLRPDIRHTASSAAVILFSKTHFDLVRPGIAVYGHWPSKETYLSYRLMGGENRLFKPVLSWKTRVMQIKKLPADAYIGYGCTYRTTAPTTLAVLPVGYADGYSRALSNQAYVLINGKRAQVRGRVCMDLIMVDITDIKGVKIGSEAVLIGPSGGEFISAEQLAGWAGTINYEILARLGGHLPRLIVK